MAYVTIPYVRTGLGEAADLQAMRWMGNYLYPPTSLPQDCSNHDKLMLCVRRDIHDPRRIPVAEEVLPQSASSHQFRTKQCNHTLCQTMIPQWHGFLGGGVPAPRC